jgi:hypothetical protein
VLGSSTGTTADAAAAIALAKLTDLCDIWRLNPDAANDEGGTSQLWPDAWTQIGFNVACLLTKQTKVTESVQAGAETAFSWWQLELPLGTDLLQGDRVVKDGMLWGVVDDDNGTSNPLVLKAIVTRRSR